MRSTCCRRSSRATTTTHSIASPTPRSRAGARGARGCGVDAGAVSITQPIGFGAALVEGLDPEHARLPEVTAQVRDALWTNGVLVIRQPERLEDAAARAIATSIGAIKDPIGRTP